MSEEETTANATGTSAPADRLAARDLPSAVNSERLIAEHEAINQGKVRTRFPPEPNGYLHVGHAKSMNMNFDLAFEKLGVAKDARETVFRYDDTNPEAESTEYIDSLREDVLWMGWKACKITYSSDYFDKLHQLAIELIKRGKAYVCHQSKTEIEACREIAKAKIADPNAAGDPCSPFRNRSVEENLREFENMRKGKYAANEATLRMKMDMYSPNPNMWDQVAYRIKYVPHPHAGDGWCIYPTYDYTHCLIDSLEHIDYSICTLEFETRRESYYWLLEALDMYRPKVYEMSRLNVSHTLLSKRKLLKLVTTGYMRGWDDPRMPTIKGLRRRGYTPSILNAFCRDIGATRNANVVQYDRLAHFARSELNVTSPRVMAVLKPLKVKLMSENGAAPGSWQRMFPVPNFPQDKDDSRGTHEVELGADGLLYIDHSDFRMEDSADYYGLAPGKVVGLKYAFRIRCDAVETEKGTGEPVLLRCVVLPDSDKPEDKPKGAIQWVPSASALKVEVRTYNPLFVVEEPTDEGWESELNPESEVVADAALCDKSLLEYITCATSNGGEVKDFSKVSNTDFGFTPINDVHVQFERLGFYVVDKDTNVDTNKIVLNLTVSLKDSKPKGVKGSDGVGRSRKEEQAKQLAEKMARMSLRPEDMFKNQTDLYSKFDERGIPTHDASGKEISKSAFKKLVKDWEKQKKLYESSNAK